tara:strand:- start:164 stop:295 length:132 start_codon:yes stop_codon:yes gene_type:complete
MPCMIAHGTLPCKDHEMATAMADPKLMPLDAAVVFFIDISFSL